MKVDVHNFVLKVMPYDTIVPDRKMYQVELILKDLYGNVLSPSSLYRIKLDVDKGNLVGGIKANLDGTFTQLISLEDNVDLKSVLMTMSAGDSQGSNHLKSRCAIWINIVKRLFTCRNKK